MGAVVFSRRGLLDPTRWVSVSGPLEGDGGCAGGGMWEGVWGGPDALYKSHSHTDALDDLKYG